MKKDTWIALLQLIKELTPYGRLELGQAGEPTLHPELLDFISLAKDMCPNVQTLIYTNGTTLLDGKITYKQLFDAGLNMIFVDMYAQYEKHKKIAEESGYFWFHQDNKPENCPNVFEKQKDPNLHIIMLAENPSNWSKRKKGRGYFSTFLNNLDWKIAQKHGVTPIINPPNRRCDLPSKFVNLYYDGEFTFCCMDFVRYLAGRLGNVKDGIEGFFKFWLGEYMQNTRKLLHNKNRLEHEYCSKCSFTSIRCDIPHWKEEMMDYYWDGNDWEKLS